MGTVSDKQLKAHRPCKKFKQLSTIMETEKGDSAYDIKTRNQKKIGSNDEFFSMKVYNEYEYLDREVEALRHDQNYHNFVEKMMNLEEDHVLLPEYLYKEEKYGCLIEFWHYLNKMGDEYMESDKVTLAKYLDTEEKTEVDGEDEMETEPDHLDLMDDKKDMIYGDDAAYEPIEDESDSDNDSYVSADEDSEESDAEEAEEETMDQ